METSVEKIKYYDSSDLAYGYMIERAIKFVEQYGESPNFNNINLVLAAYNVNDTLRMYKNDDIRMYNFNCITDTIVEVITTCNTYTLLTVHLL